MYHRLQKEIRFAALPDFPVAANLSIHGFLWDCNTTKFTPGKDGVFAVVDNVNNFKLLETSFGFFGKFKPARAHTSGNFYTSQSVWIVGRNLFANIFATGLTSLVESGIYGRWVDNAYIAKIRMESYVTFRKIKKEIIDVPANDGGAQATTLEQVKVPFVLYADMALGSLIVFSQELKLGLQLFLRDRVTRIPRNFRD